MKKTVSIISIFLLAITVSVSVFAGTTAVQTSGIELPEKCDKCGMSRIKFAHSRVLVEFEDGSTGGACSITCASYDIRQKSTKKVKRLLVADYDDSKVLIDVHDAVWVTGGNLPGVMTKIPKWAFTKKEAAERFISLHSGKIATFDEVIVAAKQETCKCGKHGNKNDGKAKHGDDEVPCHSQKL